MNFARTHAGLVWLVMVGLGSSGRSLAAPVVAPGWELNTLFEGGVGVQLPLAVAVRQWGPTGDLFFVMDRQAGPEPTAGHGLWMKWVTCHGVAGCPIVMERPWFVVDHAPGMPWATGYQPSLAVRGAGGGPAVHVVYRGEPRSGCDPLNERSLQERVYLTADGVVGGPFAVEEDVEGCSDRGVSATRVSGGQVQSCWTFEPESGACVVRCASRPLGSVSWPAAVDTTGPALQEHPWFENTTTTGGSGRIVAKRHRSGGSQSVVLSLVDAPSAPFVVFPALSEQVDYPVIESGGDGLVRAAWYDKLSAGSDRQPMVRYKVCDGTAQSCHLESHWTDGAGPIVGLGWFTDVERVELGLDTGGSGTGLQAALLMAKTAGSDPYRVYFTCRRSESEAWRPPVKLLEPDGAWSFMSQSLEYGRPHLVVDRQGDTVHAVWVQRGRAEAEDSPWRSEVVWVRGAIESVCPVVE